MRAVQLRRWVDDWRAVEQLACRPGDAPVEPEAAWRQGRSLFALVARMVGWPVEPDDIRRREDALAAEAWRRLRAAYRQRV